MKTFQRHESGVRSYVRAFPTVFDKARGSRMYDDQGRMYLDFFSGAGALNYGHNDPQLKAPLLDYVAGDGMTHSLDMATKAKQEFIERFQAVVLEPRGLSYKFLFPGPTGTNAIEAALKLARKSTGRTGVIAFEGGFHGMTLGSLSITSNEMKREGAGLPLNNANLLPFDGDFRDGADSLSLLRQTLRQAANANSLPAAVVLETVQCEGGVRVASNEWLQGVEQACRDLGVLLIVDDIQAGCGRTGKFFSFEEAGLRPDIVCLSKSLSGLGLPLALVLVREELDVFQPGEHNGTFRGHNPAFVTATAALDYWADDTLEQAVNDKSTLLRDHLEGIVESNQDAQATVRGRGMVQGIAFDDPNIAGAISTECFKRGLVIETAGHQDEVLKFLPALTIEPDALKSGLAVVRESLHVVMRDMAPEPVLVPGGQA